MSKRRLIICGAAGRDFHNFNVLYRHDEKSEVVAFTATQIPDIDGRTYPSGLSGELYPTGIPIRPEAELPQLIAEHKVDEVLFSYSDVSFAKVMQLASVATAAGAKFSLGIPPISWTPSYDPTA